MHRPRAALSFETPRYARLLRMRAGLGARQFRDGAATERSHHNLHGYFRVLMPTAAITGCHMLCWSAIKRASSSGDIATG